MTFVSRAAAVPPRTVWVVPCYNEGARLHEAEFAGMARQQTGLLFVDDGSIDDTATQLARLAATDPTRITVLTLPRNEGKAEAVRQGMRHALASGAEVVGYADADLSTPPDELSRLVDVLHATRADVVLAARVALLGREISRNPVRHYLGRVFATGASLALSLPVYDTQCGAKVFRRSDTLAAALETRFISRWVFDVELIGRLVTHTKNCSPMRIIEEPLRKWEDVPGSKLRVKHIVRAAVDLARIAFDIRRRRARIRREDH